MIPDHHIPPPFQFNPLKHHLGFIRNFIRESFAAEEGFNERDLVRQVRHLGSSVMDVYTGQLEVKEICRQIQVFLEADCLDDPGKFAAWAGTGYSDYRVTVISDTSEWTLKFRNEKTRFVHIFPARLSPFSFRVKANTLKSAMLYYILVGRDYITGRDLNRVRSLIGLPPVKNTLEAEAITKMIEVLRF
ncbi:MAG TPA: hypothetical protein PLV06_03800 [Bacteroidales bacterium]|nr:hypothetical protein [Bacteroidales bacterium]HPF02119.1 hypothetical protein [Bacteroidales bacterium]HPJ58156.1 hypothetical protein [Bacteroidales bacterium]HPR11487.1 hypothetical protein [Bacteroidales bacterium]HRW84229.1 hypothetical protein [Bacteroidales bacterium]